MTPMTQQTPGILYSVQIRHGHGHFYVVSLHNQLKRDGNQNVCWYYRIARCCHEPYRLL